MEKFEYKYDAPTPLERKQVEEIKKEYQQGSEPSKIEKLKKLDKKVKTLPMVWAYVLGIVGTLIFGTGLALVLEFNLIWWGCGVAVVGVVPIALAYSVYKKIYQYMKKKYGDKIIALSEEILGENS